MFKRPPILSILVALLLGITTLDFHCHAGGESKPPPEKGEEAKPKKKKKNKPRVSPARDAARTFQRGVRNWRALKRTNIVMQARDYSCGAAALATVGKYSWGDNVDEEFFLAILNLLLTPEEAEDRIENGLAMTDLRRAAVKAGYRAVAGKLTLAKLAGSKVPLIVGITVDEYDHFVVYRGIDGEYVYVADPIRGNVRILIRDFVKQWQKNAVLAIAKPGHKIKDSSPLSLRGEELFLGRINNQIVRRAAESSVTRSMRRK